LGIVQTPDICSEINHTGTSKSTKKPTTENKNGEKCNSRRDIKSEVDLTTGQSKVEAESPLKVL